MYKIVEFPMIGKNSGRLVSIDSNGNIPFRIKNVYYIWGNKRNFVRGKHSHKSLEEIVICVSGSCIFVLDDGKKEEKLF